jgi:hypothetical protein
MNKPEESTNEQESAEIEVVPVSALEATERASIDIQISTAKRYPRSLQQFKKRAIAMATIDEETAESCLYRRPVGKKKTAKGWEPEYAEGMSVRMAEIVGACYGNLRVYATLVEQPAEYVRARGMAIDLETNFASSSEVIESTLKQDGAPYSPRMRVVVAKATLAKARRDATFQVVPKALAKPIENEVRQVLLGSKETLEKRRQRLASWITKTGLDERRVYAAVGIEGPADLTAEKLEVLTGLRTAIKDNETTLDEAFPADLEIRKPIFGGKKEDAPNPDLESATPPGGKPEEKKNTEPLPEREPLIGRMKEAMLDNEVAETKLFKHATISKLVPEGVDELWALPTEILVKLSLEIPKLSTKKPKA